MEKETRNYKHFKMSEFDCKCGCGKNNMDERFLLKLDYAREIADIPFVINSGCRCEKHNREVGGSKKSSHLSGLAADIGIKNDAGRFTICAALFFCGFKRIGISKNFIHVDNDLKKNQNRVWVY